MTVTERFIACAGGAAFIGSAVTALTGGPSALRLAFFLAGWVMVGAYVFARQRG
jgi:hypothetical protein